MIQAVPAMAGPPDAPEHAPEGDSGPPERDSGPPEPALADWEQVAEFIGSAYRVERELPGQGLVFWVTLASGPGSSSWPGASRPGAASST